MLEEEIRMLDLREILRFFGIVRSSSRDKISLINGVLSMGDQM